MIKKASLEDAQILSRIAGQNSSSAHWTPAGFEAEIKNGAALVLKSCRGGAATGFICCRFVPPSSEITNFAVSNDFLRQGFGKALLQAALKALKQKNVKEITLEVSVRNTAAILLYEKNLFRKVSAREKFYNNIDDALIMKREL
ncbi:MAG: GNAT family N-acetyltransferase [Elusimicrobiota bacterium]|jgi:ribosomal-protein-alanine N-acetyltransferase|nr:GNAT family N-acetyltransferase [Elusimicrobiota bacterium]